MRSRLTDGTVILDSEARVDSDWQPLLVRIAPDRTFGVFLNGTQVGAGEWDSAEERVLFWQGERMPSQVRAFAAGMVREECLVEYEPEPSEFRFNRGNLADAGRCE